MDDLERAMALLKAVLDQAPADYVGLPDLLHNLATSLDDWYMRTGDLDALERSIETHTKAVVTTRVGSPSRALHLSGLGIALMERHSRTGNRDDLDLCVSTQREALGEMPAGSPLRFACLNTLGNALRVRARLTDSREDLLAAVEVLTNAADNSPPRASLTAVILANLGLARGFVYDMTGDPQDLDRAIDTLRGAIDQTPAAAVFRSASLSSLAMFLRERYTRSGNPNDLQAAIRAFRDSCSVGLASHSEQALTTAETWGAWAVARRSWVEAAEAYEFALHSARNLFLVQLVRRHKETWLRETRGLSTRAAYAMAKAGDANTAALALELGRAVLLSEALERDHADLNRLADIGHQALADRYGEVAERLSQLSHSQEASALVGSVDDFGLRKSAELTG